MSIVEIISEYHNPLNPKCRSCKFYNISNGSWLSGKCISTETTVKSRHRDHNSKGCSQHTFRPHEELLKALEDGK